MINCTIGKLVGLQLFEKLNTNIRSVSQDENSPQVSTLSIHILCHKLAPTGKQMHFCKILILFCFAFGIRLIYLEELSETPLFDVFPRAMDHSNFDQAAISFINGDWLAKSTNNSFSPLYKYFLGIVSSMYSGTAFNN